VFGARERRVVKEVDIEEIQGREKRHEKERKRNDSERTEEEKL